MVVKSAVKGTVKNYHPRRKMVHIIEYGSTLYVGMAQKKNGRKKIDDLAV